jgi:hypothetical protein
VHIAIGEANSHDLLALRAVSSTGLLYDPTSVEFAIFEPDGTQNFPVAGREDVTSFGYATGIFPAWDTTADEGWSPQSGDPEGTWSITWYWTDEDGSTELTWTQRFDVVDSDDLALGYWSYLSPKDVRDEGITTTDLSDVRLASLLARAQGYIERVCRQPFRPVIDTLRLDGPHADTIFLPVPIIGVEYVRLNDSDSNLSDDSFHVYAAPSLRSNPGLLVEDHRRNPKISLALESDFWDGLPLDEPTRFYAGRKNQVIHGVFGFLEPDGTTPRLIRDAMLEIVLNTATQMTIPETGSTSIVAGPIVKEKTDRHSIEYASELTTDSALATSRRVEEILHLFRGPIGLGAPAPLRAY